MAYDMEITSHHSLFQATWPMETETDRQTDRQTYRQTEYIKYIKNRDTQNTHIEQTEGHAEANTDKRRIKWWV